MAVSRCRLDHALVVWQRKCQELRGGMAAGAVLSMQLLKVGKMMDRYDSPPSISRAAWHANKDVARLLNMDLPLVPSARKTLPVICSTGRKSADALNPSVPDLPLQALRPCRSDRFWSDYHEDHPIRP